MADEQRANYRNQLIEALGKVLIFREALARLERGPYIARLGQDKHHYLRLFFHRGGVLTEPHGNLTKYMLALQPLSSPLPLNRSRASLGWSQSAWWTRGSAFGAVLGRDVSCTTSGGFSALRSVRSIRARNDPVSSTILERR